MTFEEQINEKLENMEKKIDKIVDRVYRIEEKMTEQYKDEENKLHKIKNKLNLISTEQWIERNKQYGP